MAVFSLILLLLIQAVGGAIVALTSFGGNLFSIPLMAWIINGRDAIVIGCLAFVPLTVIVPFIYRKYIIWKDALLLGIASLIGSLPGTWLLARFSVKTLMLLAAGGIALFLVWQIARAYLTRKSLTIPVWAAIPCGFIGGVMNGTIGMAGPPIVFYTYLRGWDNPTTLASLNICFFLTGIGTFYGQWAEGLFTPEIVKLGLYSALAMLIGFLISMPIAKRVPLALFRKLVLGMLAISALFLILRCVFL